MPPKSAFRRFCRVTSDLVSGRHSAQPRPNSALALKAVILRHWLPSPLTGQKRTTQSPLEALVDLLTQEVEIDGLRKQSRCPELGRSLSGRFVPIGSNHDDRNVWAFRLHLGKHLEASHARHVNV